MGNIGMMTNDELRNRKTELTTEFEEKKKIIAEAYQKLLSLQEEYAEINNLLSKREG